MTERDDGGQAFWGGMALRDWFAGQAAATIVGTVEAPDERTLFEEGMPTVARMAYALADAMMEARKR